MGLVKTDNIIYCVWILESDKTKAPTKEMTQHQNFYPKMLKKWKTISVNISLDHENNNMALLKAEE